VLGPVRPEYMCILGSPKNLIMKSFSITWHSLSNGEFPVKQLNERNPFLNIDIKNTGTNSFDQIITFTLADRGDDFDLNFIFKLGMLVASYKY
jgi:hypothetical protein